MAKRTLPSEGLAVICDAVKANAAAAESAGTAVTALSQAMAQGFEELEAAINDFPLVTAFSLPVNAEAWTLDNNETSDYKYYHDVTAEGVTVYDVAIVNISRASFQAARLCGLCPQNETLAGAIRIRAKSVPTSAITAEYYVCPGKEPEQAQENQTIEQEEES